MVRVDVLGSIAVVSMFCKVKFHVVRSALQISICLLGIFLLIRPSLDPTFCGILVYSPLQFKCQFLTSMGHNFCVFHCAAVGKISYKLIFQRVNYEGNTFF